MTYSKLLLHVEMKVFIEMCIVICIIYRFLHQWSEWSDCRSGQSDCYYLTLPVSVNNTLNLYIDTHPIYNNPAEINIHYYYYYYYYQHYYIIINYWMISLVSLGTPYLFWLFSNNLLISIEYWVWSWSICSSLGLVTRFTCIGEPTEDKERDITL